MALRAILALGLALGGWLGAPAALAQDPAGEGQTLDERGWLTCESFLRMTPALRSAYLIGLREGWQTAAGAVELHAGNPDLHELLSAALQDTAGWMRTRVDHGGVTYGTMLERTRIVCEREPDATAWRAWLDAIRISSEGPEEPAAESSPDS